MDTSQSVLSADNDDKEGELKDSDVKSYVPLEHDNFMAETNEDIDETDRDVLAFEQLQAKHLVSAQPTSTNVKRNTSAYTDNRYTDNSNQYFVGGYTHTSTLRSDGVDICCYGCLMGCHHACISCTDCSRPDCCPNICESDCCSGSCDGCSGICDGCSGICDGCSGICDGCSGICDGCADGCGGICVGCFGGIGECLGGCVVDLLTGCLS